MPEIFFVKHTWNRKSLTYDIPVWDQTIDYFTIRTVEEKIDDIQKMTIREVFELINLYI